jgi:hypothetical protein
MNLFLSVLLLLVLFPTVSYSAEPWYEHLTINGYVQTRYAMSSDPMMDIPLGDKQATKSPQSLYIRRIRLPISGDVSDRLSFYLQPAFEGDGYNTGNSVDVVDAYGDFHLTTDKRNRIRFGIQRVANSFDTYRSSSQRQELDRHESVQSGAVGERDLGVSYMWTSEIAQQRYEILKRYYNGPGDYGNFGIILYNGQGRNKPELNANKHLGIRVGHPFELPTGRFIETGIHAYTGKFVVPYSNAFRCGAEKSVYGSDQGSKGCETIDERATIYVWTPAQPWGILAEYSIGRGPKRDEQGYLHSDSLRGFYAQPYYKWVYSSEGSVTVYTRYGEYSGGIKSINGMDGTTKTFNLGIVWEPTSWRFVIEYMHKDGLNTFQTQPGVAITNTDPQTAFSSELIRLQAQWFF